MFYSFNYAVLMAVKVVLMFILIYIFIPSRLIRFREGSNQFLDRIFISLIHSTIITLVISHLLNFLKLYETLSLVVVFLACYVLINLALGRPMNTLFRAPRKIVASVLDFADKRQKKKELLLSGMGVFLSWCVKITSFLKNLLKSPYSCLLPIAVLVAAAVIRFKPSLVHAAYVHMDSYNHLLWAKTFGNNEIYLDSVYPMGYHAIISVLAKLSFIDPYWLIRFIGPLAGVLMVLSVYYVAQRITGSRNAGLVAMAVYGLVTNSDFPALVFRQTAGLPQEYGAIFFLPGLYFLWLYLKSKEKIYLWLYTEVLAITVFVHAYAALYLGLMAIIMNICALLIFRNIRAFTKSILWSIAAGVLALIPLGIGLLMGKPFHQSSYQFAMEHVNASNSTTPISLLKIIFTGNPFLDLSLIIIVLLLLTLPLLRGKDWKVKAATFAIGTVLMYLLTRARSIGLPELSDWTRTTVFYSLLLPVIYAAGFNTLEKVTANFSGESLAKIRGALFKVAAVAICVFTVYFYPPGALAKRLVEYDAAAQSYLSIKRDYPLLDWTLVGPFEQYEQAIGSGWHYEILRFVQKFSLEQAKNPKFDLPIPTHHIFVFTEKKPLFSDKAISLVAAEKELAPEGPDPFMQYYRNGEQRAILEAKAIRWMEAYLQSHSNVSIYFEDNNIRVYHIWHKVDKATVRAVQAGRVK